MKTDAQLIREARDDPDAFAELYLRHSQSLYRGCEGGRPSRWPRS